MDRGQGPKPAASAGHPEREAPREPLAELWKRCRAGEPAAQRELVERYRERVYRLCLRYLENESDAWDAAQELFVRLLSAKGDFADDARLEGWIVRVTHNLAMDQFRRRRKWTRMEDLDPIAGKAGPEEEARLGEEGRQVREVLRRLPEKYRAVLALREMERMEPGEIGKILKIPSGLVRWRTHRARLLFRKEWEALYGKGG